MRDVLQSKTRKFTVAGDLLGPVPLESLNRSSSSRDAFFFFFGGSDAATVWLRLEGAASPWDGSKTVSGTRRFAGGSSGVVDSVGSVVSCLRFLLDFFFFFGTSAAGLGGGCDDLDFLVEAKMSSISERGMGGSLRDGGSSEKRKLAGGRVTSAGA